MYDIILFTTALLVGLSVGIFLAFVVAVNGGLGKLSDLAYLQAMQSINRVILNPVFMIVFMGPVLLFPVLTYMAYGNQPDHFTLLLVASALYITGMFGITSIGNVPLNDRLERVNLADASDHERKNTRTMYEKPWNRLHAVRTIMGIASFASLLYTLIF